MSLQQVVTPWRLTEFVEHGEVAAVQRAWDALVSELNRWKNRPVSPPNGRYAGYQIFEDTQIRDASGSVVDASGHPPFKCIRFEYETER